MSGDKPGLFLRLKAGLNRTATSLGDGVSALFNKRKLDHAALEDLQDLLIAADLGPAVAARVTEKLAAERFDKEISEQEVRSALSDVVVDILAPVERPLRIDAEHRPHVVLVVGVNGTGKTTTIGKIAKGLRDQGKSVVLAAGDTFRAAAIEQLEIWGERAGAIVVRREVGADPAAVAYEGLERARAEAADVLLVDTAGRLQNKADLMDELAKVVRVLGKLDGTAPHDCLLVLDATTGQNALRQVEVFGEVCDVSGLAMTKLDGTARGGVLVAVAERFGLPVHFIGVGEGIDDLQPFGARDFARAVAGL
ncbi:MAG: signal recognition particle-docking protein FtsY [Alphaproteobacteria bacterium]|jgi:fused signal recognition particle receptor|nr:signal recognition particle-docking protein FtsY [Alphaproteobacteria bacterium]MDP6566076.1 signal recognition particle-docking protein FtsY [Alphaproteobacteria bacterium]MDP6812902.1 signal recognition particle-docking protein FtsY [Alphaproteobacteria bacterium]